MQTNWSLHQLTGYLQTWSALEPYRENCGNDPIELIVPDLSASWGNPSSRKQVS